MGGRGGSPNPGPSAAITASKEEREFRLWLSRAETPVYANMVGDPYVPNKVLLTLPDHSAYIDRGTRGKPIVRDTVTDDVLFEGKSDPDLYRQMSKFYGAQVEYLNEVTMARTMHGTKGNRRTSPAAKKYGIS
jgi:hypothetical protein